MKAVRINSFGPPGNLVVVEIPTPEIGPADILVRVVASGVNPIEWKIRSGVMGPALARPLPATLGWECAGTVAAVGSEVTGFEVGDAVCAYPEFARDGTHAEYVAINASQVAHKPASLTFWQAAAVPMTSQAAWSMLEAAGDLNGRRVLIHGAGGAVGHWLVQIARLRGARVIGTASKNDIETVYALGAHEVLDYRLPHSRVIGEVSVVFDLVGGATQVNSWRMVGRGGLLVSIANPPDQVLAAARGATGKFVFTQPRGAVLAEILAAIDSRWIRPLPVECLRPLAEVAAVHAGLEAGETRGKAVLSIQST